MAFDDEIIKNAVRMKNCKKIWGCVFYTYLIGGILMILYSFLSITGVSWDWLFILVGTDTLAPIAMFMILDSLVSAPLGFFLALKGSYGHSDLCVFLAPALNMANLIFMIIMKSHHVFDVNPVPFIVCVTYSLACIITSSFNIYANITYRKLEKARGFPHFSERFVEREEARNMKERMKEYKDTHKSNKKIVSDMDDISPVNQEIEKYQEVHNPSIMDDI
ncbi:MAG TPA: hypothetical protein DCG30_06350 [Ruminococcus sp.]|nr:hypothetical protein [Ruminococcus sp.]